jgi:hypothetical protein
MAQILFAGAMARVQAAVKAERTSRAQGAAAANNARFAAVMGDAIATTLGENPEYNIRQCLQDDNACCMLVSAMSNGCLMSVRQG